MILEPQSLASTGLQELMREMLVRLGEDPGRDGLRYTPERMERSMLYLTKATRRIQKKLWGARRSMWLMTRWLLSRTSRCLVSANTTFCRF
jgi:GTP cyclohydrolase I